MSLKALIVFSAVCILAPSCGYAVVGQNYSVRNQTHEEIEISVEPVNTLDSGDTEFRVPQNECVEKTVYFSTSCVYEICAWGVATGDFYGCLSNYSCVDNGYIFYTDGDPAANGDVDCDYCCYWDEDEDDDTWLFISCFITTSARTFHIPSHMMFLLPLLFLPLWGRRSEKKFRNR